MEQPYKILVFSWNTASINLGETLDPQKAIYNRTSVLETIPGLTRWQYEYCLPDFYPHLEQLIDQHQPDVVVIGFQEDRYPGSYIHSHLLPEELPKKGFDLVKRTRMMGVGVTSYKNAQNGDFHQRGIRVSIYAKSDLARLIALEEAKLKLPYDQNEYLTSHLTRGKGATVSYLCIPKVGRLALICCHLPFQSSTLIDTVKYKDSMIRQTDLNYNNYHYNMIIQQLVHRAPLVPTHVIFFGDFNYRLNDPRPANEVASSLIHNRDNPNYLIDLYCRHDELRAEMEKRNIYSFQEGIANRGPTFLPTCKLVKGRTPEDLHIWKLGKILQRQPSWCDRILYDSTASADYQLTCSYYDRFDHGEAMAKSDHAGVVALFEL